MRPRRRLWLLGILTVCVAALASALWLQREIHGPGPLMAEQEFVVRSGESVRSVLQRLQAIGALGSPRVVEFWWRSRHGPLAVRAGRYLLDPQVSAQALLTQLASGRVILESLTIIEGSRFADFRRALAAHPEVVQTLTGLDDLALMRELGLDGHPEGRFFPDTYRFAAGTSDRDILLLGYAQMSRALEAAWSERADNLPLQSPQEVLILASIIEKETGLEAERARVAGVFVSRLRIGMRLQSDPTVIYGLGESFDGDIRTRDLRTDTPYNTYTRHGLPPTPIALPGRQSLLAATRPQETGELFFVATGLGDGSHHFSRTYAEHRAAVQTMLARQRARVAR